MHSTTAAAYSGTGTVTGAGAPCAASPCISIIGSVRAWVSCAADRAFRRCTTTAITTPTNTTTPTMAPTMAPTGAPELELELELDLDVELELDGVAQLLLWHAYWLA